MCPHSQTLQVFHAVLAAIKPDNSGRAVPVVREESARLVVGPLMTRGPVADKDRLPSCGYNHDAIREMHVKDTHTFTLQLNKSVLVGPSIHQ